MLSWLRRYGAAVVASGVVFAVVALGPGCGSLGADNAGTASGSGSGSSSGSSGVDSGSSSGGRDSGSDGPDGGPPPPTTALFIQGSPSFDARYCWAKGGAVAGDPPFPSGPMPASNYPGVPRGGAAAMPDASALTGAGVTLYAIDALVLAERNDGGSVQLPCDKLVCPPGTPQDGCLRDALDYWPVPIASGSIQASRDNVVVVDGCLASDPSGDVTRCGASWTSLNGNLHAVVLQLAPGASGPGALSVQAALLSPGLAALAQGAGGGPGDDGGATDGGAMSVLVSFGPQGAADAGVVASFASGGDLQPPVPKVLSFAPGLAAFGALGFSADVVYANGGGSVQGAGHVWMSLAQAQELVDPTQDPLQFYGHSQTYLVALLGDPRSPQPFGAGTYDGTGLHLLVVTAPPPAPAAPPVDP